MKKLLVTVLILFGTLFCDNLEKSIDRLLSKEYNDTTPSISVAVISNKKMVYKKAFGKASLELNVPATPQSVYRIGSLSKQITAVAILMLIQDEEIKPGDRLIDYFPELPDSVYGEITIEQMIYHTSGIRDSENMYALMDIAFSQWYTHNMLLKMLKRQEGLSFPPDRQYEYSNSAYTLLALIVERVTGQKFHEYVNEKIFQSLGMTQTKIQISDKTFIQNRAAGYKIVDGKYVNWMTNNQLVGHDAVYSSVEDLYLWQQAVESDRIGNYRLENMKIPGKFNDGSSGNYGYGLIMGNYRGLDYYCHDGWYVGYKAFIITFPTEDFAVIALSNLGNKNVRPYALQIIDLYLKDKFNNKELTSIKESKKFTKISNCKKFVRPELGGFKTLESIENAFYISPIADGEFCTADYMTRLKIADSGFIQYTSYGSRHRYIPLQRIPLSNEEKDQITGDYFSDELYNQAKIYSKDDKLMLEIGLETVEIIQFAKDELASDSSKLKLIRDQNGTIIGFTYSTYSVRGIKFTRITF